MLVTLCGKTVDLPYLAALPGVATCVGVDGVMQAAEEFVAEQPDVSEISPNGAKRIWPPQQCSLVGERA